MLLSLINECATFLLSALGMHSRGTLGACGNKAGHLSWGTGSSLLPECGRQAFSAEPVERGEMYECPEC
jgi:hypothetical protein